MNPQMHFPFIDEIEPPVTATEWLKHIWPTASLTTSQRSSYMHDSITFPGRQSEPPR